MNKLLAAFFFAALAALASQIPARAHATCPSGKLVKTLQDCAPLTATAKKQGTASAEAGKKGLAANPIKQIPPKQILFDRNTDSGGDDKKRKIKPK